jgi:hypothetical protein
LGLDAVRSSHPIEVDCPDANQINQVSNGPRDVFPSFIAMPTWNVLLTPVYAAIALKDLRQYQVRRKGLESLSLSSC